MQKGQALILSNDAFLLPHGASLVLAPLGKKGLVSNLTTPSFESSIVKSGKIELSSLEEHGVEKLYIISKANLKDLSFKFNEDINVSPEEKDDSKIWVSFLVYSHSGAWKFRFLNETVSNNDTLLRYLKIKDSVDLASLCSKEYDAIESIKGQASSIVSAKSASDAKDGASKLAKSIASEGVSIFRRLKSKVSNTASQVKNQKFLDAVCAVSALVAFADGYASQEELSKLLTAIRTDDVLKVYSESEVRETFERFVSAMRNDYVIGEGKVMTSITPFAEKPEANTLLAFGMGIALAENGLDDDERAAIVRISNALKVSADDLLGRV